ncbi:MAG: Lipid A biosynthesis lauroyl acyltransferase [Syntrophaceae bacterium PtaU1.Bin231]|nr:MAG: Lipid A biosynthesis lauroyl acyltransferase [Syntrophaceae bacterium PtaU1.Bin231]
MTASDGRIPRAMLAPFRAIPTNLRKRLFIGLFDLFYRLSPRQRLIALHNLKCAFPEKDMTEMLAIAKGVYRTMGIVAAEFFDIPGLTRETIGKFVERSEGIERCFAALEKKRGVLMFGAHFGNWELSAAVFSLLVHPVTVIYRPLDSELLDNLVLHVRSASGNVPLAKDRAMRQMLRVLKDNGVLGILVDQNAAWQEGVFVDFFGRPACTTDGLALLALHTDSPVVPAFLIRQPNGKYRFVVGEEVPTVRTGDKAHDVLANTQNYTRIVEETVRRYPDQWLWVHQRWKTKTCQVVKAR